MILSRLNVTIDEHVDGGIALRTGGGGDGTAWQHSEHVAMRLNEEVLSCLTLCFDDTRIEPGIVTYDY